MIQIAKIAKDRFPRAPIHANAVVSLYSTEKPKAKGLRRKKTLPQAGVMIDMKRRKSSKGKGSLCGWTARACDFLPVLSSRETGPCGEYKSKRSSKQKGEGLA